VELLIRYQRVVNALAGFHLLESDAEITLVEDRVGPEGLGRWIAAEITAMTHVHFGRMLFGSEFVASRIELPRTAQFARYAAWAGCAVSGGARRASITFAARFLDLSLPTADEELWCFLRDVLEDRAEPQGLSPIVHQLRRELASVLPEGEPSLADLAGRLGHTPRTLQRRLTDEGQSYSNVLDGLRHELAVTHLRQQKLAIAEIAFSLGFDEVASFHRAFRRWENTTPAAFRRRGAARVK
jgi:AraC-like DNA-binding protein